MKRMLLTSAALSTLLVAGLAIAGTYPPQIEQPNRVIKPHDPPQPNAPAALIFSNTHNYGVCVIDVKVYNNYFGDTSKYWWTYIVRNFTFDPIPGTTNGFSGFELALPVAVPDIGDIDPMAPWLVNCCSGLPVEWDLRKSTGNGVMPGETKIFSFSTAPRLITVSSGWFHTWQYDAPSGTDFQTDIVNYPAGDEPEVPDVREPVVPIEPKTWGAIKSLNL